MESSGSSAWGDIASGAHLVGQASCGVSALHLSQGKGLKLATEVALPMQLGCNDPESSEKITIETRHGSL